MFHPDSIHRCRIARSVASTAAVLVLTGLSVGAIRGPGVRGQEVNEAGTSPTALLRAADLVALMKRFSRFADDLPSTAQIGVEKILAYEENEHFVYIRGRGPSGDRRIVFCKPTTFVIYDIPAIAAPSWRLVCSGAPRITAGRFSVTEGDATLTGQTLLPGGGFEAARADGADVVEAVLNDPAAIARFVHTVHISTEHVAAPTAAFAEEDGLARLKLTTDKRIFELTLPAAAVRPGTITVSRAGETVLAARVLPAGILPHGPEGVRLLERWDSAYRREGTPGWDVGRPAGELKRAVESGRIHPGRALVLGCGAGTNAVYLASEGFEVTGVDIAPTALALAEKRARKAGVRVRWLLADVLAVPEIGPFDFIFDRGCYHHVRRYDAAGYVETLGRLSGRDTHFLLLAGNANEPQHRGPPRVEETELVGDFAGAWDFVWLREIRFESGNPEARNRPWAWSALLRHKASKE